MGKDLIAYIDKAIELEIATAGLYELFAAENPVDAHFWHQLQMEEMNHAALLRAGKDFVNYNKFPEKLLPENYSQLEESIVQVNTLIEDYKQMPERIKSFTMAIDLENSAGELHYQQYMNAHEEDQLGRLFKRLNRADDDHAKRIKDYYSKIMKKAG